MKITSKGQVKIPQAIREKAGLLPHTEVVFEYVRGKVILRPGGGRVSRSERALRPLRGSLHRVGMSTDEIMALTRGED